VASHGFEAESGSIVLKAVNAISSRFGVAITQFAAAQILPVVGAEVNTIFMHHVQGMARARFVVRRLERKYGKEVIRVQYEAFEKDDQASRSFR
jgi:hypothetical protein